MSASSTKWIYETCGQIRWSRIMVGIWSKHGSNLVVWLIVSWLRLAPYLAVWDTDEKDNSSLFVVFWSSGWLFVVVSSQICGLCFFLLRLTRLRLPRLAVTSKERKMRDEDCIHKTQINHDSSWLQFYTIISPQLLQVKRNVNM